MNEVLLVTALAQALREDAPDRDAVWTALVEAVQEGKLLSRRRTTHGPEELQAQIRRAISRGSFRPGWLEACESALVQAPAAWLAYVDSQGLTLPAEQKLQQLLRLHTAKPDLLPAPYSALLVSIIEDLQSELKARGPNSPAPPPPEPRCQAAPTPPASAEPSLPLTRSQRSAFERLCAMAEVYFQPPPSSPLAPRLTPLLIGPTGAGKSAVAKQIASATGSHLVRVSLSTWNPTGSRDTPTLRRIGQVLGKHERVVLVIDEIDKLSTDTAAWTRSCSAEVYDLLERECAHLLADSDADRKILEPKLRTKIFFIAAGTWQHLHTRRAAPRPLGFGATRNASLTTERDITSWAISEGYPAELFGRFHTTPVFLDYPDAAETSDLLRRLGIDALAESTGRRDILERFTWRPFGLRALESLYTDLLLLQRQQHASAVALAP